MWRKSGKGLVAGIVGFAFAVVFSACIGSGQGYVWETKFEMSADAQESPRHSEEAVDYGKRYIHVVYDNPDQEQAFPNDVCEQAEKMEEASRGEFVPVEGDSAIPKVLLGAAEQAVFEQTPHRLELPVRRSVTDASAFYESFQEAGFDGEYRLCSIYCYCLEGQNYYLLVKDYGGSGLYAWLEVFREKDGKLEWIAERQCLDYDAEVIEYGEIFYLLEETYNYNSKHWDGLIICELTESGFGDGVKICWTPEAYHYERIYTDNAGWEKEIENYIETLQKDLMEYSVIGYEFQNFTGDEIAVTDLAGAAQLQSVEKEADFWQIDFNNDGLQECISKQMVFADNYLTMALNASAYRLTSECAAELGQPFGAAGFDLCQLWFKEFQDRIFTFQLFYWDDKYLLNVSLIEKNRVSQIQSWLIVPENKIYLTPLTEEICACRPQGIAAMNSTVNRHKSCKNRSFSA